MTQFNLIFITANRGVFEKFQAELMAPASARQVRSIDEAKEIVATERIDGVIFHFLRDEWYDHRQKLIGIFPNTALFAVVDPSTDAWLVTGNGYIERQFRDVCSDRDIHLLAERIMQRLPMNFEAFDAFSPISRISLRRMHRSRVAYRNRRTKGVWRDWKPDREVIERELRGSYRSLTEAFEQRDEKRITEFAADVANHALKLDELFGEGSRKYPRAQPEEVSEAVFAAIPDAAIEEKFNEYLN